MRIIRRFLQYFLVISFIFFFAYTLVQQALRLSLNATLVDSLNSSITSLKQKRLITDIVHDFTVINLEEDTNPFIVFYDSSANVVDSSARLSNNQPNIPLEAIKYTDEHNENKITWQPDKNIREAVVIRKVEIEDVKYIAVGKSLKETEKITDTLLNLTIIADILTSSVIFFFLIIDTYLRNKQAKGPQLPMS